LFRQLPRTRERRSGNSGGCPGRACWQGLAHSFDEGIRVAPRLGVGKPTGTKALAATTWVSPCETARAKTTWEANAREIFIPRDNPLREKNGIVTGFSESVKAVCHKAHEQYGALTAPSKKNALHASSLELGPCELPVSNWVLRMWPKCRDALATGRQGTTTSCDGFVQGWASRWPGTARALARAARASSRQPWRPRRRKRRRRRRRGRRRRKSSRIALTKAGKMHSGENQRTALIHA